MVVHNISLLARDRQIDQCSWSVPCQLGQHSKALSQKWEVNLGTKSLRNVPYSIPCTYILRVHNKVHKSLFITARNWKGKYKMNTVRHFYILEHRKEIKKIMKCSYMYQHWQDLKI